MIRAGAQTVTRLSTPTPRLLQPVVDDGRRPSSRCHEGRLRFVGPTDAYGIIRATVHGDTRFDVELARR